MMNVDLNVDLNLLITPLLTLENFSVHIKKLAPAIYR